MTDLSTLSPEDALGLVRAQVQKMGADYVYSSRHCTYLEYEEDVAPVFECGVVVNVDEITPTGPSCLVGHVFYDLGIPPEQIKSVEGKAADEACITLGIPSEAARVLLAAQSVQDDRKPWGEALMAAEEKYRREDDEDYYYYGEEYAAGELL